MLQIWFGQTYTIMLQVQPREARHGRTEFRHGWLAACLILLQFVQVFCSNILPVS